MPESVPDHTIVPEQEFLFKEWVIVTGALLYRHISKADTVTEILFAGFLVLLIFIYCYC